jgi:hypothetical protein
MTKYPCRAVNSISMQVAIADYNRYSDKWTLTKHGNEFTLWETEEFQTELELINAMLEFSPIWEPVRLA